MLLQTLKTKLRNKMTKSIIIEVYSDVGDGRPKHIMKARLLGA